MKYIDSLCERRKNLEPIKYEIVKAFEAIRDCYVAHNKVLICGNGGSAADSAHITGELMKGLEKNLLKSIEDYFEKNNDYTSSVKLKDMKENLEQGLPTIDLTSQVGLNTAYANDKKADYVYANAVLGLGNLNDVLIAISTSGNSKNVVNAALVAKAKNMKVIAMSGKDGGALKDIADINIVVPANETYLIQEEHIAIYHAICLDVEEEFF